MKKIICYRALQRYNFLIKKTGYLKIKYPATKKNFLKNVSATLTLTMNE